MEANADDYMRMMNSDEALCEELQDCVSDMDVNGWKAVRHPLVYSVPYFEREAAILNKRLAMKEKRLEEYLEAGKVEAAVFLYERPYRLQAFLDHADGTLSGKRYWELLAHVWTDSENVWQNLDVWENLLFEHKWDKSKYFMSHVERLEFEKMPDELTVYRGVRDQRHWKGFSWTVDLDKAVWFANRYKKAKGDGKIIKGVVKKSDVLGYKSARGESEIVCHWNKVVFEGR
jgi:hypothetical protein